MTTFEEAVALAAKAAKERDDYKAALDRANAATEKLRKHNGALEIAVQEAHRDTDAEKEKFKAFYDATVAAGLEEAKKIKGLELQLGQYREALEYAYEALKGYGCDCGTDEPGTCGECYLKAFFKEHLVLNPVSQALDAEATELMRDAKAYRKASDAIRERPIGEVECPHCEGGQICTDTVDCNKCGATGKLPGPCQCKKCAEKRKDDPAVCHKCGHRNTADHMRVLYTVGSVSTCGFCLAQTR